MARGSRLAILTTGTYLFTALSACSTLSSDPAREVSLADFATARISDDGAVEHEAQETVAPAAPDLVVTRLEDDPEMHPAPRRPGDRIVVDSLVGQVNGRPIYADDFLGPLSDRLRSEAQDKTGRARAEAFRYIIHVNLETVIRNELVIAEAAAGLTPEQQMGLLALLRNWREEMIRQGRTRTNVESELRSEMGMTLEEFLDNQKKALLVQELARKRVEPRVIVSWRDVEREYQKRYDEFNPPASVTIARIRLHTTAQGELVEIVTERIASGDDFAAIATDLGFADGGRWATFAMGPGGLAAIDVGPEMKAALAGLEVGQTSEPIVQGSMILWLHIDEMTQTVSRDLYDSDVQRELTAYLKRLRRDIEWDRYIASLLDKGIYDELEEMGDRLYEIAMDRYGR